MNSEKHSCCHSAMASPVVPHQQLPENGRILVISVAGIGNTLLATPFLAALRKSYPKATIDLLVWSKAAGAPLEAGKNINTLLVAPNRKPEWFPFIRKIRKTCYHCVITVFPSNKAAYHIFAFLTGASVRIGHAYRNGWRRAEWLLTHRLQAREELHDIDQNLGLLRFFGIETAEFSKTPFFDLHQDDLAWAVDWLESKQIKKNCLIAMHPGAGASAATRHWQGDHKRWPPERFAEVASQLIDLNDATVLLTGGPEEADLKNFVKNTAGNTTRIHCIDATLSRTAALLSKCRLMISNDSGLMHVAAAVGVPVIGLFGPTQPSRTAPYGQQHVVIRKEGPGRPCLQYPFYTASSKIRCSCAGQCLSDISIEDVLTAAQRQLKQPKVEHDA